MQPGPDTRAGVGGGLSAQGGRTEGAERAAWGTLRAWGGVGFGDWGRGLGEGRSRGGAGT